MDPLKYGDLFLVRGGGAAAGLVSAEALATWARNALSIQPPQPGQYMGLAAEGAVKAVLGILEAWGADAIRGQHAYLAEGLDYAAAGSIASIVLDILKTLGVSPMGFGGMGHVRPAGVGPQGAYYGPIPALPGITPGGGPVTYNPMARMGPMAAAPRPGYAAVTTQPVGGQGQVTYTPPLRVRPGQPVASQAPRFLVS